MKSALQIIVPAGLLLALAHLTSAQMTVEPNTVNCTSLRSLSSQCREVVRSQTVNFDEFCAGDCFAPVLRAFENCETEGANIVALNIQEACARSNGQFCGSLIARMGGNAAQACFDAFTQNNRQCTDNCRNALQGLGCCANTAIGGVFDYAAECGINSERCPLPTATGGTGGTAALHSIAGILTSLIFAGLALTLK